MNIPFIGLEAWVIIGGLVILLADLLLSPQSRGPRSLAIAVLFVATALAASIACEISPVPERFVSQFEVSSLSLFFKRFFLLGALLLLALAGDFAKHIKMGISEYYALILFALSGMMLASSANDLSTMFVSVELITVTFYVLVSFQRDRVRSLEAGVKYLILGALSSAIMVYGIALIYGTSGSLNFDAIAKQSLALSGNPVFLIGMLFVVLGLGFKIAAFPFQVWAPDVYEGAPSPTTAFLAVGSKAAGFVLLFKVLFVAAQPVAEKWTGLLAVLAGLTILYGNLCALPQRNLKRLLGYSSIAHGGYMMMGLVAVSDAGQAAIMYYLCGYLFTTIAAFSIICLVMANVEGEDISGFAGLHQRSPFLAGTMTLAIVSLAGLPPLAGFFGKFLLFKATLERGAENSACYWLVAVAIIGVVISLYYYTAVIRKMYWAGEAMDDSPIEVSTAMRSVLAACIAGMLLLGLYPDPMLKRVERASANHADAPVAEIHDGDVSH